MELGVPSDYLSKNVKQHELQFANYIGNNNIQQPVKKKCLRCGKMFFQILNLSAPTFEAENRVIRIFVCLNSKCSSRDEVHDWHCEVIYPKVKEEVETQVLLFLYSNNSE